MVALENNVCVFLCVSVFADIDDISLLSTDYWDSYWIIQGLLQSELYSTVNATLQNFMDEIEGFGFIPNGGRIYCKQTALNEPAHLIVGGIDLNRSQPPLFIHVSSD